MRCSTMHRPMPRCVRGKLRVHYEANLLGFEGKMPWMRCV